MVKNVSTVRMMGLPWFREEDWEMLLDVLEDADQLPSAYDEWLQDAEAEVKRLERAETLVVKAVVDPAPFAQWCRARDRAVDCRSARAYASEFAFKNAKTGAPG